MLIHEDTTAFSLTPNGRPCAEDDVALLFRDGAVLLRKAGEQLLLPRWKDVRAFAEGEPQHGFTLDGAACYIGSFRGEPSPDNGLEARDARIFRVFQPKRDGFALNVAQHLHGWLRTHRYCGACGGENRPSATERALCCQSCGLTIYPTIAPAIAVAITDGDRILLAQNAHGEFRHFTLIAGYVEVGETMEQTVHREVMEEVGLRVRNVRYIGNQPWGLSRTLMVGFSAELDGGDQVTLQESELAQARWFRREEIEPRDDPASISFELMERFRRGEL